MKISDLIHSLGRNAGLKLIALLLAVGLWVFVNAGQREDQISLRVQVRYRDLPAGMMITSSNPEFVDLQLSGPKTLLSLIDPGRLALRLNLAGVRPGLADFKISPQMFNAPRQVSVDRISPSLVTFDIDRMASRELPVKVVLGGAAASGYTVSEIEANPARVTVSGPQRAVAALEGVETEPLDLKSAANDLAGTVHLIAPAGSVTMAVDQVDVRVKVGELTGEREFHGLVLQVRNANSDFRLQPSKADVTVKGPLRLLSGLKLEGSAYVDALGAAPGLHELPVQVELPGGIELVRQVPEKVRLRILGAKNRAGSGVERSERQ